VRIISLSAEVARMDMLANASLTHMKEDDAALILNQLRSHRHSPPPADDSSCAIPSPGSESTIATQPAVMPWAKTEDDLLKRLTMSKALPKERKGGERRGAASANETTMPDHPWDAIAQRFEGRTAVQCQHRWSKALNPENIKGPWCANEDAQLVELVKQYGGKHWARIASMLPGRTGKQCRERWCNNLDPTLKKGAWTPEEDMTILEMHAKLGTRWAEIAKSLPGRSDNSVKNRWYSTCSRILRQQQEEAGETAAGGRRSPIKAEVVGIAAASRSEIRGSDQGECSDASEGNDGSSGSRPSTPARPLQQAKRTVRNGSASPRKRKMTNSTPPSKRASCAVPETSDDPDESKHSWQQGSLRAVSRRGDSVSVPQLSATINLPGGWEQLSVNLPCKRDEDDRSSVGESALSAESH